jgi:hypothetical protein
MSTHSSDTHRHAYSVAIALNNIGVRLLEKHDFSGACTAFKDAISAIQLSFRHSVDSDVSDLATPRAAMFESEDRLRLASQRLSNSNKKGVSTQSELPIVVIPSNEWKSSAMKLLLNQTRATTVGICVCIETSIDWGLHGVHDEKDVELTAAILLQNMGFSQICLARMQVDKGTSNKALTRAAKVLRVGHFILQNQIRASPEDHLRYTQQTIAAAMHLNTIGVLLFSRGSLLEAHSTHASLTRVIKRMAEESEFFVGITDSSIEKHTAAAA